MTDLMAVQAFAITHLWQAAAIALALAIIFLLGRGMSGAVRNALAMTALAMTIVMPLATLFVADGGLGRLMKSFETPAAAPTLVLAAKPVDVGPVEMSRVEASPVDKSSQEPWLVTVAPRKPAAAVKPSTQPLALLIETPKKQSTLSLPDLSLPILFAWAAGAALMLVGLARDVIATERLAARAQPVRLAGRLGWRTRGLRVSISDEIAGPMVAGLARPRVILPEGALERLSQADAEALLAHERAHIERADLPVSMLQRVLLAVFWWSPALYWISRRADAERELACDEAAVAATGDAHGLAATLVAEAESRLAIGVDRMSTPRLALGAAGSKSELGRRIRRLIAFADTGAPRASYAGRLAFAGLALAMIGAVVMAPRIVAQTTPRPTTEKPAASPQLVEKPQAIAPRPAEKPADVREPRAMLAGKGANPDLGAEIERSVREALAEAGIGSDGKLASGAALDASRLGRDIAEEVQKALQEALATSSLVDGDWSRYGKAWEKSFGPDFEIRIKDKTDAFEKAMEARFGPDFERRMEAMGREMEAKGREIEKMMQDRFGPEFQARMEAMGREMEAKGREIEATMKDRFGPEFQARMKERTERVANEATRRARSAVEEQNRSRGTPAPFAPLPPKPVIEAPRPAPVPAVPPK